jgi:uncharacterized Fe-S radical SAM superfamily protein PflX
MRHRCLNLKVLGRSFTAVFRSQALQRSQLCVGWGQFDRAEQFSGNSCFLGSFHNADAATLPHITETFAQVFFSTSAFSGCDFSCCFMGCANFTPLPFR